MKRLIIFLFAGALGVAMLLSGLAVDAWLHAEDPTLAQRESIFSLQNPGHALLGLGMALACGGIIGALYTAWGLASPSGLLGARWLRLAALQASAVVAIGAVLFSLSVSEAGHDHGDATHVHDTSHPHDEAMPHDDAMPHDASHPHDAMPAPTPGAANDTASSMHAHDAGAMASAATQSAPDDAAPQAHAPHEAAPQAHAPHEAAPPPVAEMHAPSTADGHNHDHTTGADPTLSADETACGERFVEEVRAATARFEDFDVAVAEGYVKSTPGKIVAHYHNWAYSRDGKILDPSRPEDLMYVSTPDGMRLAGVMFLMDRPDVPGPRFCGSTPVWHTHDNICFSTTTGAVTGIAVGGACPAGSILYIPPEMLHVWLVPNPNGPFDEHMDPIALLRHFR